MLAVVSRIACSSVLQKFISKLFKCILLWLIEVTIEMHEVIFVVRAGVVFGRYVYTPVFDSSWNEVAGKKRILACHRESTSPFRQSISFSSRNGDTGLFTISRGIRNHFNRVSPQLGVENSLKKVI